MWALEPRRGIRKRARIWMGSPVCLFISRYGVDTEYRVWNELERSRGLFAFGFLLCLLRSNLICWLAITRPWSGFWKWLIKAAVGTGRFQIQMQSGVQPALQPGLETETEDMAWVRPIYSYPASGSGMGIFDLARLGLTRYLRLITSTNVLTGWNVAMNRDVRHLLRSSCFNRKIYWIVLILFRIEVADMNTKMNRVGDLEVSLEKLPKERYFSRPSFHCLVPTVLGPKRPLAWIGDQAYTERGTKRGT